MKLVGRVLRAVFEWAVLLYFFATVARVVIHAHCAVWGC